MASRLAKSYVLGKPGGEAPIHKLKRRILMLAAHIDRSWTKEVSSKISYNARPCTRARRVSCGAITPVPSKMAAHRPI